MESWRKWFDEHKAEIAESHERNLHLKNQNEKVQQDVDLLNAYNKELEKKQAKAAQEQEAQHQASILTLCEQHSRQVEDIETLVTDLSRDAVELREGYADHLIEVGLLRSGRERAERELQDAVRNCNKAVESENQFRGKLATERRDHNNKLQSKQKVLDELKQIMASLETQNQQEIDGLTKANLNSYDALVKSRAEGKQLAAEVRTAQEESGQMRGRLEKEVAAGAEIQAKVAASDQVHAQALDEISKLKLQIEESNARAEVESVKALQAEQTLARERKEHQKDGEELDAFLVNHRKRYPPASTSHVEGPPTKKQRM